MAGITTSPQLRESPETMKVQDPSGKGGREAAAAGFATELSAAVADCAALVPPSRARAVSTPAMKYISRESVFMRPKLGMGWIPIRRHRPAQAGTEVYGASESSIDENWKTPYRARKLATSFLPASVSTLSGWNCTPSTGCRRWRKPMMVREPSFSVVQALTSSSSGRSSSSTMRE